MFPHSLRFGVCDFSTKKTAPDKNLFIDQATKTSPPGNRSSTQMNSNTTPQYMDKQIMDLSNSQSPTYTHNGGSNDFIDLMNRPAEKKEDDDVVPSYDFMPIRPALGSSSPTAGRSENLDSGTEDAPLRTWNSVDSHIAASPVRNYIPPDAYEPAKLILGRNHKFSDVPLDASLASEISRAMEKHMDSLMHAVDKMSARLSQLETRTRNIEGSIDDLKIIVENNHGATDGKMRLLENVLTKVHMGVQFIRDKHEIFEAQLQIAKLQVPKAEHVETQNTTNPGPMQTAGLSPHQQFPNVPLTQPPTLPLPNVHPQHSVQPHAQLPNMFPQNQGPPITQQDPYFTTPSQDPKNPSQQYQNPENPNHQFQNPENPNQQYQNPENPNQQYQNPENSSQQFQNPENPNQRYQNPPHKQRQHPVPPPQLQYQPPPQPQYSHPPLPPSQMHSPFSTVNPSSLPQPPVGHHPEETPYMPSQTYSQSIRPPYGQYYGSNPNIYEPPSNSIRPGPGYSGSFGMSSGHEEPYPYSSGSPVKSQKVSSADMGQSGYPQLPTARILPQALPTASTVGGGSGSGNRVPIDDVVDRVTTMGFSRDQVRATVRKLTENGQAIDLNVVLDKLMNDGVEGQGPQGWFSR